MLIQSKFRKMKIISKLKVYWLIYSQKIKQHKILTIIVIVMLNQSKFRIIMNKAKKI
jgi:hypothetical protein